MVPEYHAIPRGAIRVPVPDTTQQTDFTCGASALQAVCRYYGVGPEDEDQFRKDMKMSRSGSDPEHIIRGAKKYGLQVKWFHRMTIGTLKRYLGQRKPVVMMLQAWGRHRNGRKRRTYKGIWNDGHWVVAIGYDKEGVFFEDPSLQAIRGYLSFSELDERWHDIGPGNGHMEHYGVVIWKPGIPASGYAKRAQRIE